MKSAAIRRALISVSDKTGLEGLARVLVNHGVEIYSTGGTLKSLRAAGLTAIAVEDYTGFPEMMDGRVKTLHPKIHGGFLARRDVPAHLDAAQSHDIRLFDLVVVNLYPFETVVAQQSATFEEAVENIDIGGPAMIRSAAKNAAAVTVLVSPGQYTEFIFELDANTGATTEQFREKCRLEAYRRTAAYDGAISAYLERRAGFATTRLNLVEVQGLRYGENPHQAAQYVAQANEKLCWKQLAGKELSYNNILDLDIAIRLAHDFAAPVVAIFKHTNPCGVATGEDQTQALKNAMDTDPVSFFGGIVVFNRPLTKSAADLLAPHFFELIIAPQFEKTAFDLLNLKKNLRLIQVDFDQKDFARIPDLRSVPGAGGYLQQEQDLELWREQDFKLVTQKIADHQTLGDLAFAVRVVKFVKSNAVVFASEGRTLAIGAGQMSRIDSIRIAEIKAKDAKFTLKNSVMASEAFFPFRDSVDSLAKLGVRAIAQPGGSIKDSESIQAADEHGIVMVFTGMRHFRH